MTTSRAVQTQKRRGATATRRGALLTLGTALSMPLIGIPFSPAHAGAAYLGPAQPVHYRFRIGAFEITMISDANAVLNGPWPIVGEDQPREKVEQLMRANLLPPKKFQPGFTPMLVNTGKQLILFDAGNGADGFVPRPQGGWLAAQLKPAGFSPDDVDIVVLSHCHPDHIGGLIEAGKPLFPNARYIVGNVEYGFWAKDERLSAPRDSLALQTAQLFRTNVLVFESRISLVRPDEEIVPGIRAVAAYGHTPGHLGFHLESEGKRLLIWADCAHHEIASLAHPEWHAFFDMDKQQGVDTRKRIYDMAATEKIPVAGYHTSFPSIGFVERQGNAYHWLPVTYQFNI